MGGAANVVAGQGQAPPPAPPAAAGNKPWWEIFKRPSVASVFVLVILWNLSVSSRRVSEFVEKKGAVRETLREIRDVNLHLQLRFYQVLTRRRPTPFTPDHVSLAYIDDDTHWTTLYGEEPTSREFLAKLVRNAAQPAKHATVIGLDVELLLPKDLLPGMDVKGRAAEDKELLEAIQFAAGQGVPVVVAAVYYVDDKGRRVMLPNIFTREQMAGGDTSRCRRERCAEFGYINAPDDKRQIPLGREVLVEEGKPAELLDSFALAVAKQFRGPLHLEGDALLAENNENRERIFGTFLKEEEYPKISVADLANGVSEAEQECSGRVVLIGGHWHELEGHGNFVDQHLSPAGEMSGLGLHANYVESLLQHQGTTELPAWVDVGIDLIVGLLIYACFEAAEGKWWWRLLIVVGAGLIPVLCAYEFLVTMNVYLDFLLPLELYFLHILYEFVSMRLGFGEEKGAVT